MTRIEQVSQTAMASLAVELPEAGRPIFERCLTQSNTLWVGLADDELVCVWGVIAPTLMSDTGYLWLHTTPALKGREFLFVRHSQIAIAELLQSYRAITGHCLIGADQSRRWLRWLGAVFGPPQEKAIPFTIEAKHG